MEFATNFIPVEYQFSAFLFEGVSEAETVNYTAQNSPVLIDVSDFTKLSLFRGKKLRIYFDGDTFEGVLESVSRSPNWEPHFGANFQVGEKLVTLLAPFNKPVWLLP